MLQSFLCLVQKAGEMLFGDWCYSRLQKPRGIDSLIPRLESKPLPLEESWCINKNMVHMDPRGNKGTKSNCLKRLFSLRGRNCVRIFTDTLTNWFIQGSHGPLYCVGNSIFSFPFYVILAGVVCFQLNCMISLSL